MKIGVYGILMNVVARLEGLLAQEQKPCQGILNILPTQGFAFHLCHRGRRPGQGPWEAPRDSWPRIRRLVTQHVTRMAGYCMGGLLKPTSRGATGGRCCASSISMSPATLSFGQRGRALSC